MPIQQINGLPPLPFPAIPTAYDESLSFMELVTKLWNAMSTVIETVNTQTATINQILETLENVPTAAALQAETDARIAADNTILQQLVALQNWATAEFVLESDLTTLYLAGTINFELITKTAYDELTEYVPGRVYFVIDGDTFTIHYGDHVQPQRAQAANTIGTVSTPAVRSFSANVIPSETTVDLSNYNFSVVSSFDDATGSITPSASTTGSKIATLEFIPMPENCAEFTANVTASGHDMQFFVYYYDSAKNYLGLGKTDSYTNAGTIKTRYYANTAFVRFGFRANSSLPSVSIAEITKSDMPEKLF